MKRPDRLPDGFTFDPYLGEGLGALRMESSGMKIADEVDEGMAHALAWSIVEPEIARREAVDVYGVCVDLYNEGRLAGTTLDMIQDAVLERSRQG